MGRGWFFPSGSEGKKNHPLPPLLAVLIKEVV